MKMSKETVRQELLGIERRLLRTKIQEEGSATVTIFLSELDAIDEAIKWR